MPKENIEKNGKYGETGYPAVEKLIDTENFNEVNEAFEDAYTQLSLIAKKKGGMKTQRDVKRAMKALQLTMDLFSELLSIKYRLQEAAAEQESKDKK